MIPIATKFADRLAAVDYAELLGRLIPRGKAWDTRDPASGLTLTLAGLSPQLATVHNRLLDILEEADPRTTSELIDGWERVLGLPDPDDPSPPTLLVDRIASVLSRFLARGGTQPQILYDAAIALGYETDIEIQVPTLFRADESASDERAYDWDSWSFVWYVWRLTAPALGWDRLLALFNNIKPANTIAIAIDGLRANEVATPT